MGLYVGNTKCKVMVGNRRADFLVDEPELYDNLIFDGTAYVSTDIFLPTKGSVACLNVGNENHTPSQYFMMGFSDNGTTFQFGILDNSSTNSTTRSISMRYNHSSTQVILSVPFTKATVNYWMTPKRAGADDNSSGINFGGESLPTEPFVFGGNNHNNTCLFTGSMGTVTIYDISAQNAATLSELLQFTPVCTLRPCVYRGRVGFWNVEQRKFYGNSASGGQLRVSRSYDAEVEYLQSDGNQWIDTGYVPNNSSGMYLRAYCTTSGGNYQAMGCRENSGDTRWWINYSSSLELSWNVWTRTMYDYTNTWTVAEHNYFNSRSAKVNGTSYDVSYPELATITKKAYLFNSNNVGSPGTGFIGKISNARITEGMSMVRDFIPVRVGQVGYMYDKITGRLFANSGTGNFILGPDKTT